MKRLRNNEPSSFGNEVALRLTHNAANALLSHLRSNPLREQMAFALGRPANTAEGTLYCVKEVFLPDRDDLEEQSVAGVCPTRAFQAFVYRAAYQSQSTIVEFHTHPGSGTPCFSGIDEAHAHPNANCITEKFPYPVTLLMIVGNNRADAFDGIVYDRNRREFRQVDRFEILGRPTTVWNLGEKRSSDPLEANSFFDRQKRIPGWNQALLEQQRIGILGAGGNGAPLIQSLLAIGAGRSGFIAVADHDLIEPSNLPRVPYAYACHLQTPKVAAATH